ADPLGFSGRAALLREERLCVRARACSKVLPLWWIVRVEQVSEHANEGFGADIPRQGCLVGARHAAALCSCLFATAAMVFCTSEYEHPTRMAISVRPNPASYNATIVASRVSCSALGCFLGLPS